MPPPSSSLREAYLALEMTYLSEGKGTRKTFAARVNSFDHGSFYAMVAVSVHAAPDCERKYTVPVTHSRMMVPPIRTPGRVPSGGVQVSASG